MKRTSSISARVFSRATAAVTKAVVAICAVLVPAVAVGASGVPVSTGLANGALVAIELVKVAAKVGLLPKALCISTRVSKAGPAPPIRLFIASPTNSVVANRLLLFPAI